MKTENKDLFFITHILESIALIEGYLKNKSYQDFKRSIHDQDSVSMRLAIIGEAARNLSAYAR
jgi:uncharacterized protein with HEPN domain